MSIFLYYFLFLQKSIMVWIDHKDALLLREILLFEPFQFKPRTKEPSHALGRWLQRILTNLILSNLKSIKELSVKYSGF